MKRDRGPGPSRCAAMGSSRCTRRVALRRCGAGLTPDRPNRKVRPGWWVMCLGNTIPSVRRPRPVYDALGAMAADLLRRHRAAGCHGTSARSNDDPPGGDALQTRRSGLARSPTRPARRNQQRYVGFFAPNFDASQQGSPPCWPALLPFPVAQRLAPACRGPAPAFPPPQPGRVVEALIAADPATPSSR